MVHYIFNDFQCWSGVHIIHAAIAIVSMVLFVLVTLLITLTFFKNLSQTNDAGSKTDCRADLLRLV